MSNIVIFETGEQLVQIRLEGDNIWLTQKQMAEVFATTPENIFSDSELGELATAKETLVVQIEGNRQVKRKHYNLDAIISVGYRVNSARAMSFH